MDIKNIGGHIEVYNNGKFILSADNEHEAEKDLEDLKEVS